MNRTTFFRLLDKCQGRRDRRGINVTDGILQISFAAPKDDVSVARMIDEYTLFVEQAIGKHLCWLQYLREDA